MLHPHPAQRVGVFIDAQNLYHSAKNLYHARVNFKELVKTLVNGRTLVRAFAYVAQSDGEGEGSFFEALKSAGIELRSKELQIYPNGTKKADWDVGMAVDAIRFASSIDSVVLVTGDGDFIPLVEYLKWGLGKEVEVAGFSKTASSKLKDVADHFIEIESIQKILMKIKQGRR